MTTKTKNYTPAQEKSILAVMAENTNHAEQVESILILSVELEKPVRSITAKMSSLSRLGDHDVTFYQKPKVTKEGKAITSKAKLIEQVATKMGIASERIDSLSKATKDTILVILAALPSVDAPSNDIEDPTV